MTQLPVKRIAMLMLVSLSAALTACGNSSSLGDRSASDSAMKADIRWTDYGIVHVKADDYRGLGYGYGYAVAEDNLCLIANTYVTVNAERSKYFGPDKSWLFAANYSINNNLTSDFFFALRNAQQTVEKLLAMPPPHGPNAEFRDIAKGYVAGYNRYLRDTGIDNLPDPTCRGADWVREISEIDVYRHIYLLVSMASTGVTIQGIGNAQPPHPSLLSAASQAAQADSALSPEDIARQLQEGWKQFQMGSNAIALGSDATQTGRGMLLGNPHFPWKGGERFYQAHLTVPGKMDVTGATFIGLPLVLIGYNKDLAWTHTVSSAWRFTPYRLSLVPGDPTSYLVDGQPEAMTPWNLSVEVKQADGSMSTAERTLYTTRWGPIFNDLMGLPLFPWLPTEAYAIADANANNFRLINHFFETGQASSTRELHEILKHNQGLPWVNTIAADRAGEAFYADITVTPHVTDSKALTCSSVLGVVTGPLLGLPVLDGSRSACAWGTDSDSVEEGRFGAEAMPYIYRNDYVSNSNDSYWLSNPDEPLEGFPRIIGDERTERRMRTRLGLKMIEERLSGSDGLPGKTFSRQQLQDLLFNNRNNAAELWLDNLISLCRLLPVMVGQGGVVMTAEACDALDGWDGTNNLDSPGALLFNRFVANALIAGVPSGTAASQLGYVDMWATPFNVNDPVNTPAGLNILNPLVQLSLANAISDLKGAGFDMDVTLRESQFFTRGDEVIPIHGGNGAYGLFNDIQAEWDPAEGYNDVAFGTSFVQVVSFDEDECPDARTVLTYAQSSNPESEHYADQTRLYSEGGWVEAQFCEQEIAPKVTRSMQLAEPR